MYSRLARFSSSSSAGRPFFTPSYLKHRSNIPSPALSRPISFDSNGSRGRQGSGSGSSSDSTGRIPSPSPTPNPAANSPSTATSVAAAPAVPAAVVPVKKHTPLAPNITHASRGLVHVDSFFALHRPLLELPIRLPARRSVAPVAKLYASTEEREHMTTKEDTTEILRAANGEELVEVVDLDTDGTPMGSSYITTLSAASESNRTSEEESDQAELAAQAATREEIEGDGNLYEQFLIGVHEQEGQLAPAVSKYLATHPPFTSPSPPSYHPSSIRATAASAASPSQNTLPVANPSSLSPQTLSDLSFLRPFAVFPSTPLQKLLPTTPAFSFPTSEDLETFSLAGGFTPEEAAQVADRFLSTSLMLHRWAAHDDFARKAGEDLVLAGQFYCIEPVASDAEVRHPWEEKRKRGEVRFWNEEKGWVTVDFGAGSGGGSPFLPAEMVDLDWEDEQMEAGLGEYIIRMDSVKRKRKKKITKHKFKKRRKAQKALRQRLGK